ncbi:O-acetylhomoserine aminocarboxypropyltransferase/cysteine synthase family protein [Halovenus rubra]|uniref:O-acetylhomoserine aminocarboxypropyltransferase/cysteine synthase family protein n=2 Tax=Halovenus rubra TaxID=869890 RepID=A0ACC7DYU9_9EURY|nr:O-acetylhomoserine aminocarboxypropyltransferase/cysteine synthase family protein [Halovenus rubra]
MPQQEDTYGFDTRSVHAGTDPDPSTGARAPAIHQTTSFVFDDPDHAARLFALEEEGFIYSRLLNPTVKQLGDRLADLEGGVGAVPTSSGMAAFDLVNFLLTSAGDNIVSAKALYGGTYTYLTHTVERRGVTTRFVDTLDYEAYEEAIDEDTAYVHIETLGNPALTTPDIERVADIAHENGVPLFVDNTFATPALCRPLEHGADIIWESTTKWIHGAGSTVGGVVVDGGSFPWEEHAEKYPELAQDNPAYHGVNFAERFGDAALTFAAIGRGTRSLGNAQAPFDAWVTLQKLESFPLRVERHAENALTVAEYLDEHPDVAWVSYPGLSDHETHEEASEYLDGGYGGMVTFGLGDFETAKDAVGNTELASLLANVGDAKTLVIHPASTTHQQLTEEEQLAAGVKPDMIRLSVGIEDPADIIADLSQAIETAN